MDFVHPCFGLAHVLSARRVCAKFTCGNAPFACSLEDQKGGNILSLAVTVAATVTRFASVVDSVPELFSSPWLQALFLHGRNTQLEFDLC